MRLVVGIPMYNEIRHIYRQLENCIEFDCFDNIIVLDDGSTDGTWDVLQEYQKKHSNIHVFRNENNSIHDYGENRWMTLYKLAGKFNPTWMHIRAADMLYSYPTKSLLRSQLEKFIEKGIYISGIPMVHLWRSETWYRIDNIWGRNAREHMARTFYRYHPDAVWGGPRNKAGMHQGAAVPDFLGFKVNTTNAGINEGIPKKEGHWQIVGLHYGHVEHENKAKKFDWSMESAKITSSYGRSISMPPPDKMPPPKDWLKYNGYAGFVEWNMELAKVPQVWFKNPVIHGPIPKAISIYETIKKWNPTRAEEYKRLFEGSTK